VFYNLNKNKPGLVINCSDEIEILANVAGSLNCYDFGSLF